MEERELENVLECERRVVKRGKEISIFSDKSYQPTEYAEEVFRRKPYPTFGRPATEVD